VIFIDTLSADLAVDDVTFAVSVVAVVDCAEVAGSLLSLLLEFLLQAAKVKVLATAKAINE